MDRKADPKPSGSQGTAATEGHASLRASRGALERRLAEALEQQAATSEILRVISASPGDVQPALDAVARLSAQLCHSPCGRVLLVEGDALNVRAHYAVERDVSEQSVPVPAKRTTITGRAVVDRATVHCADVVPVLDAEFPDARENIRLTGARAVLAVPLVREGVAYGGIFLWRREPGLFAPDQVALVENFARQAAIAIENVRLFKETKEALEQKVATSRILAVISQSRTDVQPAFDTIATAARELCGATSANVFTFDGNLLHVAAHVNVDQSYVDALLRFYPRPPGRDTGACRAVETGSVVEIPDVLEDGYYSSPEWTGGQSGNMTNCIRNSISTRRTGCRWIWSKCCAQRRSARARASWAGWR
jgi:transcriptional regulator with GAF, ATPase, and Fis domain